MLSPAIARARDPAFMRLDLIPLPLMGERLGEGAFTLVQPVMLNHVSELVRDCFSIHLSNREIFLTGTWTLK